MDPSYENPRQPEAHRPRDGHPLGELVILLGGMLLGAAPHALAQKPGSEESRGTTLTPNASMAWSMRAGAWRNGLG